METFESYVQKLKTKLSAAGCLIHGEKEIQYGLQLAVESQSAKLTVTAYHGRKGFSVVVGGSADAKQQLEQLLSIIPVIKKAPTPVSQEASDNPPGFEGVQNFDGCWIGTDESGKGDVFGPLVIAAVQVDTQSSEQLVQLGVKDCKALSDGKVVKIAAEIRRTPNILFVELELVPSRYNNLYDGMKAEGKNLNHLMAWGHARVIEDLLLKKTCRFAITDQFADVSFVESRLMALGRTIHLIQTPKAERNIAVAAASILARDRFLRRLEELSTRFEVELPKGAGNGIQKTIETFVEKHGRKQLVEVGKLHFRTFKPE